MARKQITANAENVSLAELELAAQVAPTQKAHNRYRAIIALLMGFEREAVAKLFGVHPTSVRRWIERFNRQGIDGLIDHKASGRPPKIPPEKHSWCRDLLDRPDQAGQTHWTGVKFHGYLRSELQIEVGYSTVIRFLHDQNYRLKVPQPWSDRQDEAQREAFCERLKYLLDQEDVDVWFADESGFEADPRPRRRWAKRGEKSRVTKNGDHIRMNVTGMICPRTGQAYMLEFTHSDTQVFQTFLDYANEDLDLPRSRQILIVDNASWHKSKSLRWGAFEVLYLPPYSPDLNPIEKLWLLIKAHWFTDFVAKTREQLIQHLDQALCWAMNRTLHNQKTCSIKTKL